jgi:hypothetical protein
MGDSGEYGWRNKTLKRLEHVVVRNFEGDIYGIPFSFVSAYLLEEGWQTNLAFRSLI